MIKYTDAGYRHRYASYDASSTEQRENARNRPFPVFDMYGTVFYHSPNICFKKTIKLDTELKRLKRLRKVNIRFRYL